MSVHRMTRRTALSLLAAIPTVARLGAQAPHPHSARRIVGGYPHVLLLEPEGIVKVWSSLAAANGTGSFGLGHTNPIEPYTAYTVPGLQNVVAIAAGWDSSFAVLANGRVMSWGTKSSGVLGITPLSFVEVNAFPLPGVNTPTPVVVPFDAVDIDAGSSHVLALTRDSGVYSWGEGKDGQLGIGPLPVITFKTHAPSAMDYVAFPVRIPDLSGVAAVSAGATHSLALLKDGTLRAWGSNSSGELGDGTTAARDRPVPVTGIRTAVAIVAGDRFSVALLADGTVMTWGSAMALGRPPFNTDMSMPRPMPAPVPGVQGIRAIAAGLAHVAALTNAGSVVTWGFGGHGQLGQGIIGGNSAHPPKAIAGLAGVRAIFAANENTFAVLNDGRIAVAGWVREFDRPGGRSPNAISPILLRVEGLENP